MLLVVFYMHLIRLSRCNSPFKVVADVHLSSFFLNSYIFLNKMQSPLKVILKSFLAVIDFPLNTHAKEVLTAIREISCLPDLADTKTSPP